ncbi:E3 ubiquitin-protein ligase TRAF7-like isoform X2 [Babylonia areolata]|uniref:E3 ubiquitin-protein ligase TRAF7-like isoform X2 n=1 Tax=Babylonia areolata TaxID=304850 RepID=UPI003FD2F212
MAETEEMTKYVEEGSHHLKCPVCGNIYREPVINISCGHTFCRLCADTIADCPVDNAACVKEQLVINRLVVGQIDDLLIHCQHGLILRDGKLVLDPTGCPEIIVLGQRKSHEDSCPFAMVLCPNSTACGLMRRSTLEEHRLQCKHAAKLFHTHNNHHSQMCQCENHMSEVTLLRKKVDTLEKSNISLQSQVDTLSQHVSALEQFKLDASCQLDRYTSTFASLQQQCERLSLQLQQLSTPGQPLRKSQYSSSSSLAEISGVPSRGNTSYNLSPSSPSAVEKWEMPFQFKCIGTLRGHQDIVWCLVASRGRLYSAGNDQIIKVWNVDQLAKGCIDNFRGHTDRVHAMVMHGKKLFTGGADTSIRCWDTERGSQTEIVEGAHDNIICAMAIAGEYLFTSSFSLIKVWEVKSLSFVTSFSGLHHWVRALALNPAKDKLYSGSHNAIDMWETSGSFQSLGKIDHECGSVYSLAVTKQFIIAGTYNRNIQVFSATTHEFVTKLSSHLGTVTALAASLSGRFLFSASQDSNIFIWNLENFLPIQSLSRHSAGVNALAICGNLVLSGSEDHEIKVFRHFSQM